MMKTILASLNDRRNRTPKDIAIQFKSGERWLKYTWAEYYNLVESIAGGLNHYGVKKNTRVAIIANTRPEWIVADLAILGLGGQTVPIYPNSLDEDVAFIINDAQVEFVVLEDNQQIQKWRRIAEQCPSVKQVVLIQHQGQEHKNYVAWGELLNKGRDSLKENPMKFVAAANELSPSDWATIPYTSGTTGRPKGVVLTHAQIMSEMQDVFSLVLVDHKDISLSFLPYSHILGRVEAWGSIYAGYTLAFAENIDKIKQNLKEVRPTFLIAVPRIFEKIYAGILSQVEQSRVRREIFKQALQVGLKVSSTVQEKRPLGLQLAAEFEIAQKLVFDKILRALGGRLRFAVSGGAPLSAEVSRFFHSLGLLICEGYGLTETTAGISFNSPLHYKFGTVGRPLSDVLVRIAEDGEILVKSQKVMIEYYNNAEATREAFDNGYFKTGDIGHIDSDGYLCITDRKKDLIKTAGGKYVAPQKLENKLKESPYVSNVLIHGDQKKYIIALITVNRSLLPDPTSPESYKVIKDIIANANEELASHESIKKFSILPAEFTVEGGEITPSLKIKRRFCDQKYKKEIDELYS